MTLAKRKLECTRYPYEPKPTKSERRVSPRENPYVRVSTEGKKKGSRKSRISPAESPSEIKFPGTGGTLFSNIFRSCAGVKSTRGSDFTRKPRAESGVCVARVPKAAHAHAHGQKRGASRVAAGNSIRGVSAKSVVLLVCYFSDPRSSSFARNFETAQNSQPPAHGTIDPARVQFGRARYSSREWLLFNTEIPRPNFFSMNLTSVLIILYNYNRY